MRALNLVFLVNYHVVTEVVKTEFVVCSVCNICGISLFSALVIEIVADKTNRKTEVILVLKKAISNVNNITVRYSDKMIFKKDETSDLLMKH